MRLFRALSAAGVEVILVGGVAGKAHGSCLELDKLIEVKRGRPAKDFEAVAELEAIREERHRRGL